jgi:hypothetical protein
VAQQCAEEAARAEEAALAAAGQGAAGEPDGETDPGVAPVAEEGQG